MTIQISHQTRSIVVNYSTALTQLFPHGVRFTWNDEDLFAVPHGADETRMLRNLLLPVPAPIVEHYDFPSADGKRPFGKQILTAASMTMNPMSYVLNGMGTGKTKACIWAHDWLQREGLANRMLVVAPLSTLDFTWAREIFQTLPHKKVVVLTGTAERRREKLREKADIYVVNHDGVKVLFKELMQRLDIDVICFDEAAAYRNARAERSKMARKLTLNRKYIWGMTGSPTPSAPTDAFGLGHLVTPATTPRSFVQFRQETMLQVSQFKWVAKRDAAETVARVLQPSVRFSLDDIVELPPVIEREIEVPLGPRQRMVYNQWRDHASVLLKEGTITARNGGDVYNKMIQTSIGWVYNSEHHAVQLDNDGRLKALLDVIESCERKLIVFSPYKSATEGIAALLGAEKIDHATVTGDTPQRDRTDIFTAFQHTEKYKVLNAHPQCMSHGLTLTAADTVVWFGPTTKLETYEQANARITRVGQVHKQQVIKFVATPAERMTYRRLEDRQTLQDSVLDLLAEITNGDQ
jgi:SNF2 family DNA or RNA helicase